jgi:hypothetical protein
LPGIVLDDALAEKSGEWAPGTLDPRVGAGYIHDQNANKGAMTVKWNIQVPETGEYQLIFHYPPNANRATNVPITLTRGEEASSFKVNEQQKSGEAQLGTFKFTKGTKAVLSVSNAETNGHVIIDGIQMLPVK